MLYKLHARKDAFLVLYQWDMKGGSPEALVEEYISANGISSQNQRWYLRKIVRTFLEHSSEIDKLIAEMTERWDIDRVGFVERNILRVAFTELLFLKPKSHKLAIVDYVKMSTKFTGKKGAKFVNGILGRFVREKLELND